MVSWLLTHVGDAIWSGGNKGLMTGILRNEWGSQGLTITDNVLTKYVNGVDGLMAGGISTFDAMLPYVTNQLPEYENDPVVVSAMREACHHNSICDCQFRCHERRG